MPETFICLHCKHELPVIFQHEDNPAYCYLDYLSEAEREYMRKIVWEDEEGDQCP